MVGCTVGQARRRTHRRVVRSSSRGQSRAFGKPASALHACRVRRPSWDDSDGLLGTRLGPSAILVAVGVGGMGEVYRTCGTESHAHICQRMISQLFVVEGAR
jgi:hypothetical protein